MDESSQATYAGRIWRRLRAARPYVGLRWILTVAFLPFALLGLMVLAMPLYGRVRYDPAYFSASYLGRYATADATARAFEQAMQRGDREALAELYALRWHSTFSTEPSLTLVMLWGRTSHYATYLYLDRSTYERTLVPLEEVQGRWVVSPQDVYYYLRSGQWRGAFWVGGGVWWLLGGLAIGTVWLSRSSGRFRAWLLGNHV